jgi:hypothetical protein
MIKDQAPSHHLCSPVITGVDFENFRRPYYTEQVMIQRPHVLIEAAVAHICAKLLSCDVIN